MVGVTGRNVAIRIKTIKQTYNSDTPLQSNYTTALCPLDEANCSNGKEFFQIFFFTDYLLLVFKQGNKLCD